MVGECHFCWGQLQEPLRWKYHQIRLGECEGSEASPHSVVLRCPQNLMSVVAKLGRLVAMVLVS